MKVCIVSTEILGWGAAGGYGFGVRSLARELSLRGVKVEVVVTQPRGTQCSSIRLDGLKVHAYPRLGWSRGKELLGDVDADIYHSQQPSVGTRLAQLARPEKIHLVTCRDPRMLPDWWAEFCYPTYSKLQILKTAAYYESPWTRKGVRKATAVYVPAQYLAKRVARKYSLNELPALLPTPVRIPESVEKAEKATVCFVGRLDRRKRPELFFDLAKRFPDVDFIVVGESQDSQFTRELETYSSPNLDRRGFIDQFGSDELSKILSRSWVLVNTSIREGLPNSFLEASAHRCAILSSLDPDGFTTRFGIKVEDEDFAGGLSKLLAEERWLAAGAAGHTYVRDSNDAEKATQQHLDQYQRFL